MTAVAHPSDSAPDDEIPSVGEPGAAQSDALAGAEAAAIERSTTGQGIKLIVRFVRMHPGPFALSLVGGVAWALLVVAATYVLGRITDEVIGPAFDQGVSASTVWLAVAALVVVSVLRGLSVVVRRWYGSLTETRMQASIRRQVTDRLLTMPMSSYRGHPTGRLLANADVDVTTGTQLLMPLPFSIGVITLLAVSLVSLFSTDVVFAAVALVLFPLLALLSRYYTNKVNGPAAIVQARLGDVASIAHESFEGALAVKTLGREVAEDERFGAAASRLRTDRLVVAGMTARYQPLIDLLPNLGTIALLVAGAWRIDSGHATPGQLVQAVALFGWLAFPMRIVGFMFESMPRSVVSVERVDRLLDEPTDPAAQGLASLESASFVDASGAPRERSTREEIDRAESGRTAIGAESLPAGPLALEVDHVGFAYGDNTVLSDVTFRAEPGEVLALVGSTGSGKSTLANLLVRLDEPGDGEIRVGGVAIDRVDPDELRSAVSLAFQESFLFAESIHDNVAMSRGLGDVEVLDALDRARAARFVDRLPGGADTVVGERGVTLSGGQRQRVALARALAGTPRLLVLDDATSAVDPVIESEILAGLREGDTTMLVVAHRLSTILLADRVVHLEQGRVRGQGSHSELLADPDYVALVTAYEAAEQAEHDEAFADDPDLPEDLDPDGALR
ncbi:MAG: ABC transporter ATP-binding protein [Microthrixaceae bacterium]